MLPGNTPLPDRQQTTSTHKAAQSDTGNASASPPAIALPKGGGAIRGIGEKFAANPVTGTGSMTVPIATSPGRSGFGPQLSLSYDSGAGNGPFGFGWSLSLPSITRKTDKGLPQYDDAAESDVFILSGAEDLVPVCKQDAQGNWVRDAYGNFVFDEDPRDGYLVRRYRPRIEGLFARIERWTSLSTGETHWRSITRENITTLYGKTAESRIADPDDKTHIFSWLICASYDAQGNAIVYSYQPERADGIGLAQANEANRTDDTRTTNRYLKRITYGNRTPNRDADWHATDPTQLPNDTWMFEVVFDYGEGHYQADAQERLFVTALADVPATAFGPVRQDPFSSYRSGFEVRTYRLCQRVLLFHCFPTELGVAKCLVRSTEFAYIESPIASFVGSAMQSGYVRQQDQANPDRYFKRSLPPLEFTYTPLPSAEQIAHQPIHELDAESLQNLPIGLDGASYQWVDLDGEGMSGLFTEQGGGWFYKRNLSPNNQIPENGSTRTAARLGPLEVVAARPAPDLAGGQAQFLDLAGDGQVDLVQMDGPVRGFYDRSDDAGWEPFQAFTAWPNVDTRAPDLKFVDLDGDGHADILMTEGETLTWHPSLAEAGFGAAIRLRLPLDEERGPRLVFANSEQSVYLADLSGDGLTDLVRIRNGEVCYWPNLGYGRFGAKVAMDNAPWFDVPDQFDQRRMRLADTDGSGTTDMLYLRRDGVQLYFNQAGNRWSNGQTLPQFPAIDNLAAVQAMDLLGNGTACLVWSSPLPGNVRRPMRYIDLMNGQKPHLLVAVVNNLGAETHISYAPSTRFYLDDKQAGMPWVTRLPFPVHVVERVETFDRISGNRFVTRYAYHHGYFDGPDREFRGFGMVEQCDTEEFAALSASGAFPDTTNLDAASHVPPMHTKTWFHTGVFAGHEQISRHLAHEYYGAPPRDDAQFAAFLNTLLDDTPLPPVLLTAAETRELCRALKGSILRQEIYADDGSLQATIPYSVAERNYTVEVLQPQEKNRHAVFFSHPRESMTYHYERNINDPRVQHELVLEVDRYGTLLKSAAVGYGRTQSNLAEERDRQKQTTTLITYIESDVTNAVADADAYRTPVAWQTRTYELTGFVPAPGGDRFGASDFVQAQNGALVLHFDNEILYEAQPTIGRQRRLIEQVRTRFRPDDLGQSQANALALLPGGQLQSMALPGESYKLAFTPGLLAQVYQRDGQALLPTPADILGGQGPDHGGYIDLDDDSHWWILSGRSFFSATALTAATELVEARQHFFLPRKFTNPFDNSTTVDYDDHDLLVASTHDAVGNMVAATNDYRVLQPAQITDPNGNRSEARFDALGMVVGTAVIGKPAPAPVEGDSFDGFTTDLTPQQIQAYFDVADPRQLAAKYLGTATTRIIYDLDRVPACVETIARETHVSDLGQGQQTDVQLSFSYSDGFGREVQKKIQAEPGPVPQRDASGAIVVGADGQPVMKPNDVAPRWVGSGWTIFNNKGKPVRQFEPFFSDTHQLDSDAHIGVSPWLFYDPAERVVATLHPNHSWEKVVFDPWQQATYDVNDTALNRDGSTDPTLDPDVAAFFGRLPDADYLPTWYEQRHILAANDPERVAAEKAAVHRQTPTIAHLDALGRPFLTIARNRFERNGAIVEEEHPTRVELDIEGNQRAVVDAKDRIVLRYNYDMLSNKIHQASMEAGERWMLNDTTGKAIRAWDSRGHTFRTEYDPLRRPLRLFVVGADPARSNQELLTERLVYGEQHPEAELRNLRGKPYLHLDQAGVVVNEVHDFKANLLRASRRLEQHYQQAADWRDLDANQVALPISATAKLDLVALEAALMPRLETETFTTSTTYDALNRPTAMTTPDGSVYHPTYNEANLLEQVSVNLRGAAQATTFVNNIDYNAKGQRALIEYANGARTNYTYDADTFRLIRLTTTRPASQNGLAAQIFASAGIVQDLRYTYDPAGNITRIEDAALKTIFNNNRQVAPVCEYSYDAVYRLIEASGREHIAQSAFDFDPPPGARRDFPFVGARANPNDLQKLQNYAETYAYDPVGNILALAHSANGSSWTRAYTYTEASLIEPTKQSNRLSDTSVGQATERYTYDAHGNMTAINAMTMGWDFKDQLQQVDLGGGGTAYYIYDAVGQRVRKVILRQNGARQEERIYLGGFEIYREYNGNIATVTLERETLHVMDDKRRVALVETRTIDASAAPNTLPSTTTRYQFDNHLGSASLEQDEHAGVISYEEYYPYGSTSYQAGRSAAEVSLKRYRYTGKERDQESGLYYHGARYYAPGLGRWTSCDPVVQAGKSYYAFSRNNPTRFADPDGRAEADSLGVDVTKLKSSNEPLNLVVNAKLAEVRKNLGIKPGVELTAEQRKKFVEKVLDLGSPRGSSGWSAALSWVHRDAVFSKTYIERYAEAYFEHQTAGDKYSAAIKLTSYEFGRVKGTILGVRFHLAAFSVGQTAVDPSIVLQDKSGTKTAVGTDKLGHFFAQGFEMFDVSVLQNKGDAAAEKSSHEQEMTIYGLKTTGVYSLADREANTQGMRFYKELYQNPFMTFDIANYASTKWNEPNSPNVYSKEMEYLLVRDKKLPFEHMELNQWRLEQLKQGNWEIVKKTGSTFFDVR